ncbi:MAG: resuscitation-promoting factor RpfB [Pseudonocardiales bacterium]|nr:resuscitation-promoting factor RpfB [Pseudonocardiales bacterium]MDT4927999.1 resuscitation-promoting factor RpfB [Pseudonocardiales bacterium]
MLRSIKYGLHGAVLAGLVAAPVVWNSVDKSVHLVVDGKAATVQTTAADVGQVVRANGYSVGQHDLLAPSADSSVHDGMRVVLRKGRLLRLNVDGKSTSVWTTAPTVQEALAQLGYSTSDFVSVSRARRLPLRPTDIAIRTPRLVTVLHDGAHDQVTTTDSTVGQLLAEIGITVGKYDRVSPAVTTAVQPGQLIKIQRVGRRTVVRTKTLNFPTTRKSDATLAAGSTRIITPGRDGKAAITYSVVYLDGKAIGETKLKSVVLAQPQTQVVNVGTKPTVTVNSGGASGSTPSAPIPSPGSAQAIARTLLKAHGWGSQSEYDCLVQMWNHESGWRVNAANPSGAYGIPQALPGSKMASAGSDWQTSATTQIKWGLGYIGSRYGTPCGAWSFWQGHSYY